MIYLMTLMVFDFVLMPFFRVGPAQPLLLYLMVPYAVFEQHWNRVLPLALLVGFFRDIFSPGLLGVETVTGAAASAGLILLVRKIERGTAVMRMAASFLYIFLMLYGIFLISKILGGPSYDFPFAFQIAFASAFETALLAPPFFYLTARWFHDRIPLRQYELFG